MITENMKVLEAVEIKQASRGFGCEVVLRREPQLSLEGQTIYLIVTYQRNSLTRQLNAATLLCCCVEAVSNMDNDYFTPIRYITS